MKRLFTILAVCGALAVASVADAKGGSSSGGGHASSGGGRSSSSVSSGSRGGFSSGSVARAPTAPSRTTTTTTTTHTYRSQYVSPGPMYGGWGMGYGYTNGLLTGMIIAGMMHPHNTVMYVGPGPYANNALLYPDGRVVNQQGYLVGNYVNGQFTAVQNGPMVAQQVPADAGQQQVQPTPVVINTGPSAGEIFAMVFLGFAIVLMFVILLGVIL